MFVHNNLISELVIYFKGMCFIPMTMNNKARMAPMTPELVEGYFSLSFSSSISGGLRVSGSSGGKVTGSIPQKSSVRVVGMLLLYA